MPLGIEPRGRDLPRTVAENTAALRQLEPAHLPHVTALTRAIGWPHRLEDMQFALALGQGFAVVEEGRLIGAAMWWPYGERHAMVGTVIVSPEQQGRGIGRRLMQAIIKANGDRSLLLNATEAGLPLYKALGFEAFDQIGQYQGVVPDGAVTAEDPTIRPATPEDLPALISLDRSAAGLPRDALTTALTREGEVIVLEDQALIGFSIKRAFGRGSIIGPVVAPDATAARALIGYWLKRSSGAFIRIDLTGEHGLADWLTQIGFGYAGPAITMVRGEAPSTGNGATLFAVSSQAMG